jgi:hypothetical protein
LGCTIKTRHFIIWLCAKVLVISVEWFTCFINYIMHMRVPRTVLPVRYSILLFVILKWNYIHETSVNNRPWQASSKQCITWCRHRISVLFGYSIQWLAGYLLGQYLLEEVKLVSLPAKVSSSVNMELTFCTLIETWSK